MREADVHPELLFNVGIEWEGYICPYCDKLTRMKRAKDGGVIRFCDDDEAIWYFHLDGKLERLN